MTAPPSQRGQPGDGGSTAPKHNVPATLYNVREAAQALRLSRSVLYELISSGRLRSIKQGGRRLVSVRALDEYVASMETRSSDGVSTTLDKPPRFPHQFT